MALIGKIRNNTWIILLFIGGGIALFIFSEMSSGANGPIGPVEQRMGQIGQREIDYNEFQNTLSGAFSGGDLYQNRDQLWQFYVDESILAEEAEEMGLAVTAEEIRNLEFGPNPSPVVQRNFRDQQTGQVNRELLTQIQGHIDAGTVRDAIRDGELASSVIPFWRYQRRNVVANRLQEKMNALVGKAMYAPSWQAQTFADAQLGNRRVAVVKIPYTDLDATDQDITDADVQAYIDENSSIFNNPEETRTLEYIVYDVEPTDADLSDLREDLTELATDWRNATNASGDSLFAVANGGRYTGNYEPRDRLDAEVADRVLEDMENGEVFGPYEADGQLKLIKLVDRFVMADSAKTRHILISTQGPGSVTLDEANRTVDSLMTVLTRSRRKFSDLAAEFSTDPGSKDNGGVYEKVTPGQFVPAFDAVLFRTGDVGKLYKVRTSYGVHLVEVMERSRTASPRAIVATTAEPVIPSSDTELAMLSKAQDFLSGKRKIADLTGSDMEVQTTNPLRQSTYDIPGLGAGQEVRDMMCFAFGADAGELSDRVYGFRNTELFYEDKYVIIGVKDVIPAGVAPVASVRDAVESQVQNRVVGERTRGEIASRSLADVASQYGVAVDTVNSNPSLTSLPRVGAEPKVIAAAASTPTGQTVAVAGQTGVYLLTPINDAAVGTSGSVPGARAQINSRTRTQATSGLLAALRQTTNIEDERSTIDCR